MRRASETSLGHSAAQSFVLTNMKSEASFKVAIMPPGTKCVSQRCSIECLRLGENRGWKSTSVQPLKRSANAR
jgi:hypothetical protein